MAHDVRRPTRCRNHYDVSQDSVGGRQKIVRDKLETVLTIVDKSKRYNIYPAGDKYACFELDVHSAHGGPTRRLQSRSQPDAQLRVESESSAAEFQTHYAANAQPKSSFLVFVLPDLREDRWVYKGETSIPDLEIDNAHWYEYLLKEGDMDMTYRMYVSEEGHPLRLWQLGANLYSGGHKDIYVSDYYNFKAVDDFAEDEFAVPEWGNCNGSTSPYADALGAAGDAGAQIEAQAPSRHWGDAAYDSFVHASGRRHRHAGEYHARRRHFHASRAAVEAHNAAEAEHGFRLGLNRFADWTPEEWEAVTSTETGSGVSAEDLEGLPMHQRTLSNEEVPAVFSWQGTPMDSPVKDQGACGSCWTFSTVSAVEAAYYRVKGEQRLFSEQNLIDCSWVGTNRGCYGGRQITALDWIFQTQHGLAGEAEYPYRGLNDWCRKDVKRVGLKGRSVQVPADDHEALKEAIATKGPITVSVDAGDPKFKFYAGGLYKRKGCGKGRLNHAVIVSGYGTTDEGEDYWLVKNMWSPFWGEKGYVRIARSEDDCGISKLPVYAEIDEVSE